MKFFQKITYMYWCFSKKVGYSQKELNFACFSLVNAHENCARAAGV